MTARVCCDFSKLNVSIEPFRLTVGFELKHKLDMVFFLIRTKNNILDQAAFSIKRERATQLYIHVC